MPKCIHCAREFSTDAALAQHVRDKHPLGSVVPQTQVDSTENASSRRKGKPKSLRKKNRHPVAIGLVVVAVVVGLVLYAVVSPQFAQPPDPCIAEQNYYIHVHPFLQIVVNGENVAIPSDVGILQNGGCLEPIHTHDASGILHVELSQTESGKNWTLSDFFTIWKFTCQQQPAQCPVVGGASLPASSVVFNQTDILGYKADANHRVQLLINGTSSDQWGSLNLEAYDYCSARVSNVAPCFPTAGGTPAWECVTASQCGTYPYPTGNEIVISYSSTA